MIPTLEQIKLVRNQTQRTISDIRKAFNSVDTFDYVFDALKDISQNNSLSKNNRPKIYKLHSYCHYNGRCACIAKFSCETDFVANNPLFKQMMHDVCMHLATCLSFQDRTFYESYEVYKMPFIKDDKKNLAQVLEETSSITGEKIELIEYTVKHI